MPRLARLLGFAGLLPQALCLLLVLSGNDRFAYAALAMGFAYAALIFSFLGGLWWGLAARAPAPAPDWLWMAAVAPSLIALASFLPWAFARDWPGPSLLALGAALIASVSVDLKLVRSALAPDWWLPLRIPLSLGLGGMTLALGVLA